MELTLKQEHRIDALCSQYKAQRQQDATLSINQFLGEVDDATRPHLVKRLRELEAAMAAQSGSAGEQDSPGSEPEITEQLEMTELQRKGSSASTCGGNQQHSTVAYQIVSQLSADGSGLLYRAIRDDNGDEIDVLVLSNVSGPEVERIKKRISLASRLDHPAASRIIDASQAENQQPFLLEPTAESSLMQLAADKSHHNERELFSYVCQVASVMVAGHRLGLAHGNVTPHTAYIRDDGSLQFDFVRPCGREQSEIGADWQFSAPEVGPNSDPDAAADVFSLASLLVWMFSGPEGSPLPKLPEFRQRLEQCLQQSAVPQEELDALCDTIKEALAADPGDRVTAHEVWVHLERLLAAWRDEQETMQQPGPSHEAMEMTSDFDVAQDSGSAAERSLPAGKQIGRFRVRRKIGEGGMGAVFEAEDPSDGSTVALKVLSRRVLHEQGALRRFYKEARLLGQIKSPYVTNLLEINHDNGLHYIVMEYVAGVDLRGIMRKGVPLDEKVALSIIADTARGLVSAHQLDIIHRDIKPGNILLTCDAEGADQQLNHLPQLSPSALQRFRVKLSDFGLARELDQSESMKMTRAGGILGTPTYMSPEQFANQEKISPATDVYAIGVTLFEMLAGRPPFIAPDVMKLINMHCRENPEPLQKFNPEVSEATCEIVQRAIAKSPDDRYADAGQFLRDVERVLRGEATNITVHPELPPHQAGEVFEEVFEWQLKSSAADLWPYVSNTERINSAVGVPSVAYQTQRDERGRLRKYGTFKMAGLKIGWEEHPFEWVEGQRLGILREFNQGPFVWFLSIVELVAQASGGTLLRHSVRIKPRGLVGRLVARLEVTVKGKRNLDRVYHRIDESVSGGLGNAPTVDAFADPERMSGARRQRLEQRIDRLAERGIDPDTVRCLGDFLRDAPSQELARIRPIALARNFGLDADDVVNGCLRAATEGLLDLHWDILCPTCRVSSQVAGTLQEIDNHARCEVCDIDFDVDLSNSVEMVFRANPEIRSADLGTYCIGGPEHSPHVVLQIRLAAGKRVELTPVLSEGEYVLRSAQLAYNYRLRALPAKGTTATEIVLSPEFDPRLESQVRAGRNVLTITNQFDHEIVIRLERSIPRKDVMTAARATALPVFRELFPAESPKLGRLINVQTVTLLAIDVADTEHLYFELGDGSTYSCVQSFQGLVERIAKQHSGALIKVLGTEVQFAFETPIDALRAVVDSVAALEADAELDLQFCAGVHRGTALATSSHGRLDYFGGTVHVVQRMLRLAQAGELLMTEIVAADPLVAAEIRDQQLPAEVCDLPQIGPFGSRCQRLHIG